MTMYDVRSYFYQISDGAHFRTPTLGYCTEHRSFSDFSAAKEEIIQFICDERILTCRFASGSPVYCEKQDPWLFCKSGYKVPIQVTLFQIVGQMKKITRETLDVRSEKVAAADIYVTAYHHYRSS